MVTHKSVSIYLMKKNNSVIPKIGLSYNNDNIIVITIAITLVILLPDASKCYISLALKTWH